MIAARLGLTGALGTTAEHVDGVYTGRLRGDLLHGPAKAEAVRALAHEHGLDLARCFAYSDSVNDLPMLSLVGHPCAINPDPRLLAHAEEQDWQVRDYRTGRRAARVGLLGAAGAGATAGAVATGLAVRRRLVGRRSKSPRLTHQVLSETAMTVLGLQAKPGRLVDPPGGDQDVVGPQHHPPVVRLPGEVHAAAHQGRPDATSAGRRRHQQDPELGRVVVLGDAEHAADPFAGQLGDPALLPRWVVRGAEVADDPGHQRLEGDVPAELAGVLLAVGLDHPARGRRAGRPVGSAASRDTS